MDDAAGGGAPAGSGAPAGAGPGKDRCDLCNKEVGAQALHRRIGFTPGTRVTKVCGACFTGKLHRDERLRFAKPAAAKARKAKAPEEEAWSPGDHTPPDELRFGR